MGVASRLENYARALRPLQWIKNSLVLAAPFLAKVFLEDFRDVVLAFTAFCAASSIGYLVNDWRDKDIDSHHPIKKFRPFANQSLKFYDLMILLAILIVIVIVICYSLPISFSYTVAAYLAITLSYSYFFKFVPVIEIVALSLGFMARAIGGATAVDVSISAWFLIFSGYGALFIVSTKRLSEFKNRETQQVRSVMSSYTESFLTTVVTTALTISLLTYALWVFSVHEENTWATFSILPVTVAFLRYTWHKEHGSGEAPERMIFSDASILFAGVFAVASLTLAVYR